MDTTLDLNINPFYDYSDKVLKREFERNYFADFERKAPVKEENGVLMEELNRISTENQKLTEMLATVCENYNALHNHFIELMSSNKNNVSEKDQINNNIATSRKRKTEQYSSEDQSNMIGFNGLAEISSSSDEDKYSCKRPKENIKAAKVSRVCVRTNASDTSLIVKDGYQWRKYGQKVTRDNPSPRAYFKCSFAPSCPVKKKVQRSAEDPSILIATYEGEHNHPHHSRPDFSTLSSTHGSVPAMNRSSAPTVTLDLVQTSAGFSQDDKRPTPVLAENEVPAIQQILVQQMASSLTRDPNFRAALAAAISGRFLD